MKRLKPAAVPREEFVESSCIVWKRMAEVSA